jgi:hypothetical protein
MHSHVYIARCIRTPLLTKFECILKILDPIRAAVIARYYILSFFFFVAVQSLKDPDRLTYNRFLELFRHMVGLLGQVISPSQGLYLHRTTQHRMTRTNIHALSGIRTHDPRNQPAKTHASDRTATVTGTFRNIQM